MPEQTASREQILVVDDSEEIRSVLHDMYLGPQGFRVLTARDGKEGLDIALKQCPDLILLDVNMPRMTGLEVLEELRKAKYEYPVVMMTFEGSEEIAVQAFRLGVRDYLIKPLEIGPVLAAVDRVLQESRLRREREILLQQLETSNRQLNRRVSELGTLYALGQALTSVLDLDKLLNRIVEAAVFLCRADECSLYLIDEESGDLYMTAAQGVGEKQARGLSLRVSDSMVNQVVNSGKPVAISAQENDSGPGVKVKTGYLVHSLLNVPLKSKTKVMGVLSVANRVRRQSFTREDLNRINALANYAAIAIDNARLYEQTRKVVAAEMLNHTAVTVSHYVNTPLMTLNMRIDGLIRAKQDGRIVDPDDLIADAARFTQMKVEEIASVIAILRDMASPRFVTYLNDIQMLDIEGRVRQRLESIKKKYEA
ncbi:MAG: response regulator [Anaerolineae bacterium]|nr:response regulator [Anaerolineae bacterium]